MTLRLGALAWLLAVQFFAAQVFVAAAWPTPYSLKSRVISDLGNTRCGDRARRPGGGFCSPWHAVMNASFIVVGITMAVGAVLSRNAFRPGWLTWVAVLLFVAAGIGVILVGIYPENESESLHTWGAAMNFLSGNTALILFGLAWPRGAFRWFSVGAGLAGLAATVLFANGHHLGLGPGGIERVAAYTTASWQIVAGTVLMRKAAT